MANCVMVGLSIEQSEKLQIIFVLPTLMCLPIRLLYVWTCLDKCNSLEIREFGLYFCFKMKIVWI